MGTVLLSSRVFKSFRQKYNDAAIAVAIHQSWSVLIRKDNYIDEVITFTDEISDPHSKEFQHFAKELSKHKFDITFFLSCQFDKNMAFITRLTESPLRISYKFHEDNEFFNVAIKPSPGVIYEVDRYLGMLRTLGIECSTRDYTLTLSGKTRKKARKRYLPTVSQKEKGKLVGFDLTKEIVGEHISKENAETVIKTLITEFNATVALFYEPEKIELATALKELYGKDIILADYQPVSMLAGLMTFCRFVVTHNTDLLQLAVALKTPTIAILTKSDMTQWSPGESKNLLHLECTADEWPSVEKLAESVKKLIRIQESE